MTIARAAGPGRYDHSYEKEARDYPFQYVRWTEGRNLEEVVRLMGNGRLSLDPLVSRVFPLSEKEKAYALIMEGKPEMGYIIDWMGEGK